MLIDLQFNPAFDDWATLRGSVQRAEAEGFDTVWVFDHFDGAMLRGLDAYRRALLRDKPHLSDVIRNIGRGHELPA